ncbi:MAG: hypothetical protein QG594_135 [Bacteroidota bacterium]|jgi:uncharacterized protein YggT (Ycf19 family)|nr:hypothetical protein [Bacteroidota bacterium]
MNYLKYTQYLYLVFALFFVYEAATKWNQSDDKPWAQLFIAAMAVFMFFFRRKFTNKITNNKS